MISNEKKLETRTAQAQLKQADSYMTMSNQIFFISLAWIALPFLRCFEQVFSNPETLNGKNYYEVLKYLMMPVDNGIIYFMYLLLIAVMITLSVWIKNEALNLIDGVERKKIRKQK